MPESNEQRHIRRGISQWLTKQVNTVPDAASWQAGIRAVVLEALNGINQRFAELRDHMHQHFHIAADRELLNFYMKGGNAFKVAKDDAVISGGDSDWDTQVVVDVWAPPPVIDILHGRIEDIVLDQLKLAGLAFAAAIDEAAGQNAPLGIDAQGVFAQIAANWKQEAATAVEGLNLSNYELAIDEPQTIRRMFDHDRLGLWLNTGSPFRDKESKSKWLPGLLFNDAIKPFILYRMGYTWHATLKANASPIYPRTPIARPILMELIDITIPRRNTVEAVEVWDAIEDRHMTLANREVGFQDSWAGGWDRIVMLPFPDLAYHLSEQLDMLCEIADGSSRHSDKMARRFQRLREIFNNNNIGTADVLKMMSARAGVASIAALDATGPAGEIVIPGRLYELFDGLSATDKTPFAPKLANGQYSVQPADQSLRLGVLMMDQVIKRTRAMQQDFASGALTQEARERLTQARSNPLITTLTSDGRVLELAYSDDLSFMNELGLLAYLDLDKVGTSGVDPAVFGRVGSKEDLHKLGDALDAHFAPKPDQAPTNATLRGRYYTTPRENGYSYEYIGVRFTDGKPDLMLTLTTANPQEQAFQSRGGVKIAPLVEIARQRKMAASLIRDYVVRTALAKQYEAGKESIAVI